MITINTFQWEFLEHRWTNERNAAWYSGVASRTTLIELSVDIVPATRVRSKSLHTASTSRLPRQQLDSTTSDSIVIRGNLRFADGAKRAAPVYANFANKE